MGARRPSHRLRRRREPSGRQRPRRGQDAALPFPSLLGLPGPALAHLGLLCNRCACTCRCTRATAASPGCGHARAACATSGRGVAAGPCSVADVARRAHSRRSLAIAPETVPSRVAERSVRRDATRCDAASPPGPSWTASARTPWRPWRPWTPWGLGGDADAAPASGRPERRAWRSGATAASGVADGRRRHSLPRPAGPTGPCSPCWAPTGSDAASRRPPPPSRAEPRQGPAEPSRSDSVESAGPSPARLVCPLFSSVESASRSRVRAECESCRSRVASQSVSVRPAGPAAVLS